MLLHQLHGIIQHRQVTQTQEVHFQQAKLFQRGHDILADHRLIVLGQGHIFVHRPLGDDHTGGMGGSMAGHALQRLGGIHQLLHLLVRLVHFPQRLAQAQGILQGDVEGVGDLLGDLVGIGIGDIHDTGHIADDAAGRHGTEGDDLGHMVIAVLAADIIHHLAASGVTEVHIDIGHADTFRVQETLEIEAVLHGVDVGDAQTVTDHGAGGAASAGADGDIHAAGIAHEVGNDEEIVRKAHFLDHFLLIGQLSAVLVIVAVALPITVVAQFFHVGIAVVSGRQFELRQVVFAEGKVHIAHIRNFCGVFDGTLISGEQGRHFRLATQIEVTGLVAHAVLVRQQFARLDAQQHIVGFRILTAQVVGIVGADQRQARLLVEAQQVLVHLCLLGDAMVLQLQIEAVGAEDLRHLQRVGLGIFILAVAQALGDLARKARRQGNKAAAVLFQQLHIDAGLDVKTLCPGHRNHVGEVFITLLILTQQHQMAALCVEFVDLIKAGTALRRDIHLAADDGLHALCLTGAIEINGAVHHAVVCDGAGSLPHLLHHFGKVFDAAGTVQQTELRMHM